MKVTQVFFSPSGSTKKISNYLAAGLSGEVATVDLLQAPLKQGRRFKPDELLLVCLPVFAGCIPGISPCPPKPVWWAWCGAQNPAAR